MNMMQTFVKQELENQIKTLYPHLQYPSSMYARVVSITEKSGSFECTLKILDNRKQPDSRFPEVPKVTTDLQLSENDIVIVLLLYGKCIPYIIGRC